jgi:hypothetical protein
MIRPPAAESLPEEELHVLRLAPIPRERFFELVVSGGARGFGAAAPQLQGAVDAPVSKHREESQGRISQTSDALKAKQGLSSQPLSLSK